MGAKLILKLKKAKTNSKLSDSLNEVSVVEYGETLKTRDLVGKTFTINSIRGVTTTYGDSHVGDIELDGTHQEAWLSGVILAKQINEVLLGDGNLPATVTLVRDQEINGEPFRFIQG